MSAGRLPRPHEWVLPAPFPWATTSSLGAGAAVRACFNVVAVQDVSPDGHDHAVELLLSDARERVTALIAPALAEGWLRPGMTVGLAGTILPGAETRIAVDDLAPVQPAVEDLELFLPRSRVPAERMDARLVDWIDSITDRGLHRLLARLLSRGTQTGDGFRLAPAAMRQHHAVLGGLLEHTLSVTAICDALAAHYGDAVDRDLLIAGALLHDIGKVLEIGARAGFPYTDEGRLLGHIVLGLRMVDEAALGLEQLSARRLLLLQHLIASHQGRYEWQSPREPRTLEALILHHADNTDAKVSAALEHLNDVASGWTSGDHPGFEWLRHKTTQVLAEPTVSAAQSTAERKPVATRARKRKAGEGSRGRRGRRRRGRKGRKRPGRATGRAAEPPGRGSSAAQKRDGGTGTTASPLALDRDTLDMFGGPADEEAPRP